MRPFCKKCLIEEMDFDAELQGILDYIKAVPTDKRVSDEEYNRRLQICRECDDLVNGICAKCGCFVELRALKLNKGCASEQKKW